MKRLIALFLLVVFIFIVSPSYAHPGSLDSNGGHYDYDSGEYHYHHGYPAHSHTGGKCPYDFHDNTDDDYSPSYNTQKRYYTSAPRPTSTPRSSSSKVQKSDSFFQKHPVLTGIGVLGVGIAIWVHVVSKKEEERERERKEKHEKERQEALSFYSSHDLRTLCGIPDQYYLNEKNIPCEYNKPDGYTYGVTLDVYISYGRSDVYHRKGCRFATRSTPLNVFSDRGYYLRGRYPCHYCKPDPLPDEKWFIDYKEHIRKCEEYNITPQQNPLGYCPPVPPSSTPPPDSAAPTISRRSAAPRAPVARTSAPRPAAPPRVASQPVPPVIRVSVIPTPTTIPSPTRSVPPAETLKQPTVPDSSPGTSAVPTPSFIEPGEDDIPNVPVIYREKYPRTWAYIQRHSSDAQNYVYYYHYVWGKLQEHHGDGIIYGSLTEEEQKLVNYPSVDRSVYLSSESSDTYHSTSKCYSLLRSTPIEADKIHAMVRKRCTKCVSPE